MSFSGPYSDFSGPGWQLERTRKLVDWDSVSKDYASGRKKSTSACASSTGRREVFQFSQTTPVMNTDPPPVVASVVRDSVLEDYASGKENSTSVWSSSIGRREVFKFSKETPVMSTVLPFSVSPPVVASVVRDSFSKDYASGKENSTSVWSSSIGRREVFKFSKETPVMSTVLPLLDPPLVVASVVRNHVSKDCVPGRKKSTSACASSVVRREEFQLSQVTSVMNPVRPLLDSPPVVASVVEDSFSLEQLRSFYYRIRKDKVSPAARDRSFGERFLMLFIQGKPGDDVVYGSRFVRLAENSVSHLKDNPCDEFVSLGVHEDGNEEEYVLCPAKVKYNLEERMMTRTFSCPVGDSELLDWNGKPLTNLKEIIEQIIQGESLITGYTASKLKPKSMEANIQVTSDAMETRRVFLFPVDEDSVEGVDIISFPPNGLVLYFFTTLGIGFFKNLFHDSENIISMTDSEIIFKNSETENTGLYSYRWCLSPYESTHIKRPAFRVFGREIERIRSARWEKKTLSGRDLQTTLTAAVSRLGPTQQASATAVEEDPTLEMARGAAAKILSYLQLKYSNLLANPDRGTFNESYGVEIEGVQYIPRVVVGKGRPCFWSNYLKRRKKEFQETAINCLIKLYKKRITLSVIEKALKKYLEANESASDPLSRCFQIKKINDEIGYGVFARCDLPAKAFVGVYVGELTKYSNIGDSSYVMNITSKDIGDIFGDWVINAKAAGNYARFFNHAKISANLKAEWLLIPFLEGEQANLLALKLFFTTQPVSKGQELRFNYKVDPERYWGEHRPNDRLFYLDEDGAVRQ